NYVLEQQIGAGGMATVYLARDARHDRRVAVKVMHPELASTVGADRFLREISIAARLQHPHILGLLDSGNAAGLLYYVMPFVDGAPGPCRAPYPRPRPAVEPTARHSRRPRGDRHARPRETTGRSLAKRRRDASAIGGRSVLDPAGARDHTANQRAAIHPQRSS